MPVFSEGQKKKGPGPSIVNEIVGRVNDNTKRLRLLEERERMLTGRMSSTEESVFQKIRDLEESMKDMESKLAAQDGKVETLQNTLKEVIKQLNFAARKSDIKRVEETLKLMSPFRSQAPAGSQDNE